MHTIDPDSSDNAALIAVTRDAARSPQEIGSGTLYAMPRHVDGPEFEIVDTERFGEQPYQKRGSVSLHEPASLIQYVDAHKNGGTALYANIDGDNITAVLNGHGPGDETIGGWAGWGDHRASLTLRKTPEWKRWAAHDRQPFKQDAFAEFVEESIADIHEPDGATMLELAQTFEAKKSVAFRSQTRLSDGQRQLTYAETIDAAAGSTGQLQVPEMIVLGIAPYEGSDPYRITARLRFRLGGEGTLTIVYILDRPEDTLRSAFGDIVKTVETETSLTAYRGSASPPLRS